MDDLVVCLGCGGVVVDGPGPHASVIPPGEHVCRCVPEPREAPVLRCSACGGSLAPGGRACAWCHATVATSRCPHCLGWNLATAQHCQTCGITQTAAGDELGGAVHACPRCASPLTARRYAELEVSECDACGGMHLSPPMMDRVVAARDGATQLHLALPRKTRAREASVHYVKCPLCETLVNRKMFARVSSVVVDVCRKHGVWFDPGELDAVLEFITRGGLDRARAREMEELRLAERSLREAQMRASMGAGITQSEALALGPRHRERDSIGLAVDVVAMLSELWS